MMKKQKRFTDVRKHQRHNPVNPGRHWVRKHQRFIGYRDKTEIKLLQPTHIADIKGVGGVTTEKLANRGYLTLEDAERLAQDPEAQAQLVKAGIRLQTIQRIVKTTGIEPKPQLTIEEVIARGDITEGKLLRRWGWVQQRTDAQGKIISREEAIKQFTHHLVKERGFDVSEKVIRDWVNQQTAEKVEKAHLTAEKRKIIQRLKYEPVSGYDIEKEAKKDPRIETAINEMMKEGLLTVGRSGFIRLKQDKAYEKAEITKLLKDREIPNESDVMYSDVVAKRDDLRLSRNAFWDLLNEMQDEGKLLLDSVYTRDRSFSRITFVPSGAKTKQDYFEAVKKAKTEKALDVISKEKEFDAKSKAYRQRLQDEINKRRYDIKKVKGQKWLDKQMKEPKKEKIIKNFFKNYVLNERAQIEGAMEVERTGIIMGGARVSGLATTDLPLAGTTAKYEYFSIKPKRAWKKKQLEEHDFVFGTYSPSGVWRIYRTMGRGATYHIPKTYLAPMYVEKDGIRMYLAPKIQERLPKGDTVESWAKKQYTKFHKTTPEYAKET